MALSQARGYFRDMSHHHTATFVAIGASLFASMFGAFTAIFAGLWAARRSKRKRPAYRPMTREARRRLAGAAGRPTQADSRG